jgi:hypothetical protein
MGTGRCVAKLLRSSLAQTDNVLTVTGFSPSDTAKMHNAIRAKSAPLGADAVIITDEGIYTDPWVGPAKYASGVAIAYKKRSL